MIFILINDDVIKFGRKKATEDEMNAALELKSDEVPQSITKGFKIWTHDIFSGTPWWNWLHWEKATRTLARPSGLLSRTGHSPILGIKWSKQHNNPYLLKSFPPDWTCSLTAGSPDCELMESPSPLSQNPLARSLTCRPLPMEGWELSNKSMSDSAQCPCAQCLWVGHFQSKNLCCRFLPL